MRHDSHLLPRLAQRSGYSKYYGLAKLAFGDFSISYDAKKVATIIYVSTDEIRKDVAKLRVQGIRIDDARGRPERLFVKGAVLRAEVAPYSP